MSVIEESKENKEKKLKIALCLSGQPRFYNSKSYLSIKKEILDKYDTDVFIHTWLSSNPDYKYPYASWSGIKDNISFSDPSEVKNEIIKLYNPKMITTEEPRIFRLSNLDENKIYTKKEIEIDYLRMNVPSSFYSMSYANNLRKEYSTKSKVKYDWVIRARFDTFLLGFPNLALLDNTNLFVPNNCPNPEVCNDNFSWCGPDIANIVYDVYNNLSNFEEKYNFSPERIWFYYISSISKLNIIKMNFYQNFSRDWSKDI